MQQDRVSGHAAVVAAREALDGPQGGVLVAQGRADSRGAGVLVGGDDGGDTDRQSSAQGGGDAATVASDFDQPAPDGGAARCDYVACHASQVSTQTVPGVVVEDGQRAAASNSSGG